MGDWFLGEIRLFPYNTPVPSGWMRCEGQLLQINQNQALAALLGSTYGGDQKTVFALPDLRGRVPVHFGQNPTLGITYSPGNKGGLELVTITTATMPPHAHAVQASPYVGTLGTPTNNVPAEVGPSATAGAPAPPNLYNPNVAATTTLIPASVDSIGGGAGHENRQPSIAMVYCIATSGVFPPRN